MLLKRVQIALSSSSTFALTSPIIAFSRTIASRADVCSSFTAFKQDMAGFCTLCVTLQCVNTMYKVTISGSLLKLLGPVFRSLAYRLSQYQCSALCSPCKSNQWPQNSLIFKKNIDLTLVSKRRCTYTGMSLKQLMHSIDFFSVENMM